MASDETDQGVHKPALIREVLTPGRDQTGIAVVLVAASALAFALAGSAFALWARSASHCDHHHRVPAVMVDADQLGERPCSQSISVQDGIATYRLCPTEDVTVQPAHEVEIEEHEGMVVYRIVK